MFREANKPFDTAHYLTVTMHNPNSRNVIPKSVDVCMKLVTLHTIVGQ